MILAILLAAQAHTVAVLEFRDKVPKEERLDSAYLSDQVRTAVKDELPEARVITRENMLVLLQASGKDLAACEGECEVDTGRLIGADLVVSGELLKFGTQYKLNMKLHDTRSGELLSGAVAAGPTADQLDRALRPAMSKLLGPLLQTEVSQRRSASPEGLPREQTPPRGSAALWLTAGYDWATNSLAVGRLTPSQMGWDVGGHLMVRTAGPVYLGGLVDYGFSGPNALLIGPGLRLAAGDAAFSGAFGYSSFESSGLGALVAVDLRLEESVSLRAQGSWRHSSTTAAGLAAVEDSRTVWSLQGGFSLRL